MSERYRKFYCEYKNKLFSYLMFRSGDYEVARDIMQESFTRHFKHYGNQAVISPALLFTIARNALVDHHRYNERFQAGGEDDSWIEAAEEETVSLKEQTAMIRRAMRDLPRQDREMLVMAVEGVPYRDIAALFRISEGNVKVRLHRIRSRLREIVQKEEK